MRTVGKSKNTELNGIPAELVEQNVDKTKIHMKTATGFTNLLKISKNISESEGLYIFVDSDFDDTKKCIESANKGDVPVGNQKSYKPKKIGNC